MPCPEGADIPRNLKLLNMASFFSATAELRDMYLARSLLDAERTPALDASRVSRHVPSDSTFRIGFGLFRRYLVGMRCQKWASWTISRREVLFRQKSAGDRLTGPIAGGATLLVPFRLPSKPVSPKPFRNRVRLGDR